MNKWDKRFMEMTELIGSWSSCFKSNRKIGAIIVRDKRILTTGYNGAPAGMRSCVEKQACIRMKMGIDSGTHHELCYAIHAEQNAILQAARMGIRIDGATLYCSHQPCAICTKMIINVGIVRVVYRYPYPDSFACQLMKEAGIQVEEYHEDDDQPA